MTKSEYISYLNACFKQERLIRWPDNTMPLKVYVAPFRWYKEKNNEYQYYGMIQDAINTWEAASGGKVRFEFVKNLYDSNINIEWKRVERKSLGHCNFSFDTQGRLYSAEVSIGLSDGLIHRQYQDKNEVSHTIIHEIGHALGLQHSPYNTDIMYVPHQYGVVNISGRDATTLKWMYTFPYGATKDEVVSFFNKAGVYDPDRLIYLFEKGEPEEIIEQPEFIEPHAHVQQLHIEQNTLANLNKFNLSIQNIGVSSDAREYFKKLKINKDLKGK